MKKLYIKFEKGNKESLQKAVDEAERLGYEKWYKSYALRFEWYGILQCKDSWNYYTSWYTEGELKNMWYTEHKIAEYKEGDWVYVRDSKENEWKKRIYLYTLPYKDFPHICVYWLDEDEYQNGESYNVLFCKYIKPYKDKVTIKTEDRKSVV